MLTWPKGMSIYDEMAADAAISLTVEWSAEIEGIEAPKVQDPGASQSLAELWRCSSYPKCRHTQSVAESN